MSCTGDSGALSIPLPPGPSVTVDVSGNLNGGISITGIADAFVTNSGNINGNITAINGHNFTFIQNGSFGAVDINANSTGTSSLLVNPGRSVAGVTMTGANNVVDNSGTFNAPLRLTATGQNSLINRAGGQFNTVELTAPRNVIDNAGRFNGGLRFTSDSTNVIQNRPTGIINGITSTGASRDQINNEGQINGSVSLGDGDDWYVNLGTTSPGTLLGGVDLGGGNDIFYITGGLVSSPVNLGSGNDWAAVLGGTLSSDLQAGSGADQFHWAGGNITAGVDMGADDDRADFYDLTQANLLTGERISGGTGNDTLVWHNTIGDDVSRFVNWEFIELTRNSQMIFSNYSTLTMGDSGTGTGVFSIDETSRVLAGNGTHTVTPATPGQLVSLYNAGVIDLTNSQPTMTDRFTVVGNYIGVNGQLNLQTYLGDDNSPSDRLVIRGNGARAVGSTQINVINLDGPGAMTTGNGIKIVDADLAGGATTDAGSFALGSRVAAGIYEYALFRGGVGPDAGDNDWYLRSSVLTGVMPTVPSVPTTPEPPPVPAPVPQPPVTLPAAPPPIEPTPPPSTVVPPTTLPMPVPPGPLPSAPPAPPAPAPLPPAPPEPTPEPEPAPGPEPTPEPEPTPTVPPVETPLVRPEIPGYTIAPAVVHRMGIAALDKFHSRHGDQSLLSSDAATGSAPGTWARGFGQAANQERSSRISGHGFQLAPKFDGHIWGIQAGFDILGWDNDDGSQDRLGLFYTHMEARGDTIGNVLAGKHIKAGSLKLDGDALGAYWTRISPAGWYIDAVGMLNWLDGKATSDFGGRADVSGHSALISLESGYPIALGEDWMIEPQAQLIWQRVDLNDTRDQYSDVGYDAFDTSTGRLGVRLESNQTVGDVPVQPFVEANLWHDWSSSYTTQFTGGGLKTQMENTTLELGTGISAQLSGNVGVYGSLNYSMGLAGDDDHSLGGNIGLRVRW